MEPLEKAMQWARGNYLSASIQHKAAFANSVAYLVTGMSGGFGGPSLREHLCSWSLAGSDGNNEAIAIGNEAITLQRSDSSLACAGEWEFDEAIAFCENRCFDPAEKHKKILIQIQEREHCFDDDPKDLEELRGKSV